MPIERRNSILDASQRLLVSNAEYIWESHLAYQRELARVSNAAFGDVMNGTDLGTPMGSPVAARIFDPDLSFRETFEAVALVGPINEPPHAKALMDAARSVLTARVRLFRPPSRKAMVEAGLLPPAERKRLQAPDGA